MKDKRNLLIYLLILIIALSGCNYTAFINNGAVAVTEAPPTETFTPALTPTAAPIPTSTSDPTYTGQLKVHFIDVNQGDSILIELPNNKKILIDAGDNHYGDTVVSYLKKNNITDIDYAILTHPDADHSGGYDDVIYNFPIGAIFMPDIESDKETFKDVKKAIEEKQIEKNIVRASDILFNEQNGLKAVFVAPVEKINDTNEMSLVLHLTYKNTTFLFTGDASQKSESAMLNSNYNLNSDMLKVGHHGSSSSSTREFIKAVSPKYAIISCGLNNRYNHPTTKTLNTLQAFGIETHRTDLEGTIIAISDGQNITLDKNAHIVQPNAPPPTVAEESQNNSTNSDKAGIYVTRTGKAYHKGNCSSLSKSKIPKTLSEAKQQGYKPCGNCHPSQ